jgi:hypothetical protein
MLGTYFFQFFWGLVVLAAFVGWGQVVHRALASHLVEKPDWGLYAGWGMASSVLVGGIVSMASLVSAELIIAYVAVGAGYAVLGALGNRYDLALLSGQQKLVAICIAVPLLSHYGAVVHMQANSCADDAIAYFPFITRLLDTGTLIDPYSLRRLAGYGGHTFLQALIGAVGTEENAYLMDRGIAFLLSFGLILGYFRDRSLPGFGYSLSPLHGVILAVMIFAVPMPLMNSASHLTALVIFLVLFRTLDVVSNDTMRAGRSLLLIGMIVAAAGALRIHFLFAGALGVTFFWAITWYESRANLMPYMRSLVGCGVASLICLLPWMVLLNKSSGSYLYPLFAGNHRSEFEAYAADLSTPEQLQFVVQIFSEPRLWFLLVPLMLYIVYRHNRAAFSTTLSAVLTTVVLSVLFTLSDIDNIHRYAAPIMNAAIIASLISFIRWARNNPDATKTISVSSGSSRTIVMLFLLLVIPVKVGYDVYRVQGYWPVVALSPRGHALYEDMQESIPAGEAFFAVVFHPFAWDYARNPIASVDTPGAVSPDPGLPYFSGSADLRDYLQTQSINYVAMGDFEARGMCLYNRRLWQFHLEQDVTIWKQGAPYYLDLMDNLEDLAKNYPVIFQEGGFRVIDVR